MSLPTLRVLVVDDEPLARQRITDLLAAHADVQVVGEAGSGRKAVAELLRLRPDIAFLDVQMPGLSGLDVAREIGADAMPVTVFVTAYDQHALAAFDAAAVDYLLKPFEDARFARALARAREAATLRTTNDLEARLRTLLGEADPPQVYAARIAVESRGAVRFVPVETIDYVTADGPYAVLHADGERFVVREPMHALEGRLDPAHFARIHRSTILRLDRIESLRVAPGGDYSARLRDGTHLRVSRTRYDALTAQLAGLPRR